LTRPGFTFEDKNRCQTKRVEGDERLGAVRRKSEKRFRQLFEIDQQQQYCRRTNKHFPKSRNELKALFPVPTGNSRGRSVIR
jgi:hypothetical protein